MKKQLRTPYSTRQYMVNKDFEIYFYSEKNTPHVNAHNHNYYEFYFFIEGEVSVEINGEITKLTPGDIVVIPPGCKHRAIIEKDGTIYSRFVFWVSSDFFQYMFETSVNYGYLIQHVLTTGNHIFHNSRIEFNTIESKVFTLIEELSGTRFGKDERVRMCVMDLMLHLNRTVYEANHPVLAGDEKTLYENLLIYLEQHLEEELTLDKLAAEFYVSKYHIEHVFKDQMGLSLHQYVIKKRLESCRQMILSGRDIQDASEACGFTDYSSFYRAFKKEYGTSPKEYKRLYSPANLQPKTN